ncbi:MAG TPA: protein kinase [Gemmatimonadales bacterium]|nr:protein kinase [Gemmatimonadales bacterium]
MNQPTRACPTCHTPLPGMAAFCYVCGTATPPGMHRDSGQTVAIGKSGIGPVDLMRKLQRALGPGYELGERIGAGGFAEVFRVRDLRLKRDLAAKVLRPDLGLSPDLLQRFRREAETIATLRNPHIVPVYDIGEAEGLAFIIMPLIEGESLRATLDREGPMAPTEVQRILSEAASGLAAAHEAGVIHRDIKPENIMLEGKDKRVLLMDFGIAKAVSGDETDPSATLTTTGIIVGTPQYMSPEQACGDKTIDARTDQYSLAVVAYRMLSGALPFEGESTRAMLYQQLVAEPPPIASKVEGVPAPLAHAIERAMAKEPADRFPTMIDFAAALESPVVPRAGGTGRTAAAKRPVNRMPLMVGGGVLVAALLGFLIWRSSGGNSPASAQAQAVTPLTTTAPVIIQATTPPPPPAPPPSKTVASKDRGNAAPPLTTPPPPPAATPATAAATVPAGPTCAHAAAANDWKNAAAFCPKEAAAGSAVAQRILGGMYDRGNGVTQDPAQAFKYYKSAAATDLEAKMALSSMLQIGRGTQQNTDEAVSYLREAAAGGLLKAQITLAFQLENGAGIKRNDAEAALWYRRAAEKGDLNSELKLADFLAHGRGINKNEAEALDWYKKAANQGSGDAAWHAWQMYSKGQGTAKDETAGMDWLRKAAKLNQPDAVKELKKRDG